MTLEDIKSIRGHIQDEIIKGYGVEHDSHTSFNLSDVQATLDRLWPLEGYLPELIKNANELYALEYRTMEKQCPHKAERSSIKWIEAHCAESLSELKACETLVKSLGSVISALQSRMK